MNFKEKIKPPLVLTVICAVTAVLLAFAYNLTYVDTTGIITGKLSEGLREIYGSDEGFEMLRNEDGSVTAFDGVTCALQRDECVAFEVTADGYAKGGLHLLIGFDERGAVCGISVLDIGESGQGLKVKEKSYLSGFNGIDSPGFKADSVTGATYSSKGVKNAVAAAVNARIALKEDSHG